MKCTFEIRNNVTCIVIKLDCEKVNGFVYPMIVNNDIAGLITPACERTSDNCVAFVYSLGEMVSLSWLIARGAEKNIFYAVYDNIKNLWSLLDSYMIPDRCCMWNTDYMYVDPKTGRLGIICLAADVYISDPLSREWFMCGLQNMTGCYIKNGTAHSDIEDDGYETVVLCASECGKSEIYNSGKIRMNRKDRKKKRAEIKKQKKENKISMKKRKRAERQKKHIKRETKPAYRIPESNKII